MTSKQEQYYTKVMRTVSDVFKMMFNTNEPLPSVDGQEKVIKIIQDTNDKINELIDKK